MSDETENSSMPHRLIGKINPARTTAAQLYPVLISMLEAQRSSNAKLADLQKSFEQYKADQKDMLATWTTAKYVLSFIKILGLVGLPVSAILALFGYHKNS